jgi:hypothetical protein
MPTRCNRWIFYCRSYCLLNMFRAPLCPSSGAREYYTSGCCVSYLVLGFQVFGVVWSWGLCVRFAGCNPQTRHTTLNTSFPHGSLQQKWWSCFVSVGSTIHVLLNNSVTTSHTRISAVLKCFALYYSTCSTYFSVHPIPNCTCLHADCAP